MNIESSKSFTDSTMLLAKRKKGGGADMAMSCNTVENLKDLGNISIHDLLRYKTLVVTKDGKVLSAFEEHVDLKPKSRLIVHMGEPTLEVVCANTVITVEDHERTLYGYD